MSAFIMVSTWKGTLAKTNLKVCDITLKSDLLNHEYSVHAQKADLARASVLLADQKSRLRAGPSSQNTRNCKLLTFMLQLIYYLSLFLILTC